MLKSFVALIILGSVCGGLLVGTNELTSETIAANRSTQTRALLAELIGRPVPNDVIVDHKSYGDCTDWLALNTTAPGYAGPIEALSLWRPGDPSTLSIRVVHHSETPGIGTFIAGAWMTDLDGFSESEWATVDAVTGATVTTQTIRRIAETAFTEIERGICG